MDTFEMFLRRKRVDLVRETEGGGGVVSEDSQREDGTGVWEETPGGSAGGTSSEAMSSKSPAPSSRSVSFEGWGCFFPKRLREKARAKSRDGSKEGVELRREPRRPRGSFDWRKLCADVVCSQVLQIRTCEGVPVGKSATFERNRVSRKRDLCVSAGWNFGM